MAARAGQTLEALVAEEIAGLNGNLNGAAPARHTAGAEASAAAVDTSAPPPAVESPATKRSKR